MTRDPEEIRKRREELAKAHRPQSSSNVRPPASAFEEPSLEEFPELAGLADVEKTLKILSLSSELPPSSAVAGPTADERRLHLLRMSLVNDISISSENGKIQGLAREAAEKIIREFFEGALEPALARHGITMTKAQRVEFIQSLVDEITGLGPIEPLIRDPEVSEIMVNGPWTVFAEKKGKLVRTAVRYFDAEHMMNILFRIVSRLGRSLDQSNPHVDARLADGSRVHAIIPPLAIDGPTLTIRKFKKESLQMEDMVTFGSMTSDMAFFLGGCVKARLNIIVSGGTGTGKTTLLNVLASLIPGEQRIVTIEDAAELKVRDVHPHVVRLESRLAGNTGRGGVAIRDLVRDALRMRPDRIIVGECRGGETLDMLQAMNTGHDGSMTTAHANSSVELLQRVETMCLMAGLDLPIEAIRRQIASAIDLIVHIRRYPDGTRKTSEITEVAGIEGGEIRLHRLFWFDATGRADDGRVRGEFRCTDRPPGFIYKFETEGLQFPSEMFGFSPPPSS